MKIPHYEQETEYTCGPACCRMILASFGIKRKEKQIASILRTGPRHGTMHKNFQEVAERYKARFISRNDSSITELREVLRKGYKVVICYLVPSFGFHHYSVLRKIDDDYVYLNDPAFGAEHRYSINRFKKLWGVNSQFDKQRRWFAAFKKVNGTKN